MGRAIVRDPQVFLFDEPLSNLDAKLRVQMRGEIKGLHQRLKTTTIYVTHDQIEAMTMADKIVVMRDGLVEQIGAPLDLYDRPANMFVAGFIGSPSMNFVNGRIEEGSFVAEGGFRLPLPEGEYVSLSSKAVYGMRPEHMKIADNGVPVAVEIVEPTGSEIMVMGKLGDQPVTCLFRERLTVRPGDVLTIAIDPATSHVFEPEKACALVAKSSVSNEKRRGFPRRQAADKPVDIFRRVLFLGGAAFCDSVCAMLQVAAAAHAVAAPGALFSAIAIFLIFCAAACSRH